MTKSRTLLLLLLGLMGGIFYQSFWSASLLLVWLILIGSLIVWLINYKNRISIVLSLIGIFFLLGVGRTELELIKIKNIPEVVENISLGTQIIKEPEKKEYYQNLVVAVAKSDLFGTEDKTKLKILVRTELYRNFKYGDIIQLNCQPEVVKNISSDFDYRMYLAKDEIYYTCPKAEIKKIKMEIKIYMRLF